MKDGKIERMMTFTLKYDRVFFVSIMAIRCP